MKSVHDAMLDPDLLGRTFSAPTFAAWRAAGVPGALPKTLPPYLVLTSIPYPEHELTVGGEGTVDVEFTLDSHGQLQGFNQTYTDGKGLGEEIPTFLRLALFLAACRLGPCRKSLDGVSVLLGRISEGELPGEAAARCGHRCHEHLLRPRRQGD